MTYPSSDVNTSNLDAGTDSRAAARVDLFDLVTKFNLLRNHISSWFQTFLTASSASDARTALGITFKRNYHQGFSLSTLGGSTTMTITSGVCADSTNTDYLVLTTSRDKTTAAWSAGPSASGGLDTGTIAANTWYYFYVIRRPDTGAVDILFSTSHTSPTLPTNYTQQRLIMAWRTNASSQWESWVQTGDRVDYQTYYSVFSGTIATTSRTLRSATLPNAKVLAHVSGTFTNTSGSTNALMFTDPSGSDVAPSYSGSGHIKLAVSAFWGGAVVPFVTSGVQIGDRVTGDVLCSYGVVGFDFAPAKGR